MTFTSSADLSRLHKTDPALPVVTKLADGLFTDNTNAFPDVIALMEPHDVGHPLAELSTADDIQLEGILEHQGMYLIALETDYGYGIALVIPKEEWLSGELYKCIEDNLYN